MACTLTTGRKVPCKSAVGGLKTVYFADFGTLGAATISGGEVTALAGSPALFQFDIKGNSSLETAVNSSRENGTTFYEQTLNLTLKKLSKADNKELKLMAYGRPHVAVEDYNGNFMMVGLVNGADVSGGTVVTGAAMGDLSGYTLTLTGMETTPANFMKHTSGQLVFNSTDFAGLSGTITITEGTNS